MIKPPSLRFYFTGALLIIITVVTAFYALAIRSAMDTVEQQLATHNLNQAMEELALSYQLDPHSPIINTTSIHRYAVPADDLSSLPRRLARVNPGITRDIGIDDNMVHVSRQDLGDTRLYVTLSIEELETQEAEMQWLLWGAIISGYVLSLLGGWLVARLLSRPIMRLADQVSQLTPSATPTPLDDRFHGREVATIARAIDGYVERLSGFVGRERAFTEDASHELRTPLATLLSAVPLLENDCPPESQAFVRLQRIRRAGEQMQALVESLLFLAREEGDLINNHVAMDLLVHELVEPYRKPSQKNAAGPIFHLDLHPCTLTLPRGMAVTVIGNLLLNAIEHTDSGTITVQLRTDRLSIADSGEGILPGDLEHIFERRYRGTDSRGLGLGLYLVKRICDRLHWHLQVDSTPGQGTAFRMTFPTGHDSHTGPAAASLSR